MAVATGVLPERYADPRLIGHGGMGEIYLARDRQLERPVAVKILAEHLARDDALRVRFTREAMTAARLSGEPHVATIFDVGEWKGRPYIVMEYLAEGTLAERAREQPVDPAQALVWLQHAAEALDAAHRRGVVHRDVKPANLLFDERGDLHVADFGVARLIDETTGLTAAGTVLGTAGYISPEQARGERTTEASDLYSLAVVAYELLTGGRPFSRSSPTAEALAHVNEPVPRASERGVGLPASVNPVFERALAKEPRRRYGSAADFVAALRAALAPAQAERTRIMPALAPPRRHPAASVPLLAAVLILALVAGVVAAALATGNDEPAATNPQVRTERVTITQKKEGTTVTQTVAAPSPPPTEEGAASIDEAVALTDQATGELRQGDWDDALALMERALPPLQGTYRDDFPYEAYAEYNTGKALAELGRCDEALPHLERSEELQGPREPITAAKQDCG